MLSITGRALTSRIARSFQRFSRSVTAFSSVVAPLKEENPWANRYRVTINQVCRSIADSDELAAQAAQKHLQEEQWKSYISTFRRRLIIDPVEAVGLDVATRLHTRLEDLLQHNKMEELFGQANQGPIFDVCRKDLFELILCKAEVELKDEISAYTIMTAASDLRVPHEWYPFTRLMKRKIYYHGGPTNSGKTYTALQRLKVADEEKGGGLYCGPLRLLALEVYESLNKQGVITSLVTGQEKKEIPGSSHTSCTLEMVSLQQPYDVAVIDEIQMIADPERGYAWTRALLGLRAREIHVCGGIEAADIVQSLATSTGDDFELVEYKRLSTLEIAGESLKGDYSKVRPGDCIVAFSKVDIFSIRKEIERLTPYKCAVIYGQLPSETRSTQARLFNEPDTGFDILVASDAIGMGLNLNIRRIIFHTTIKGYGGNLMWVTPSGVKQIAGRAGRMSSQYKVGEVTTWQEADLAYVKAVMQWDIEQIKSAGVFPSVEQIESFSDHMRKTMSAVTEQQEQEQQQRLRRELNTGLISDDVSQYVDLNTPSADARDDTPVTAADVLPLATAGPADTAAPLLNTAHDDDDSVIVLTDHMVMSSSSESVTSTAAGNDSSKVVENGSTDAAATAITPSASSDVTTAAAAAAAATAAAMSPMDIQLAMVMQKFVKLSKTDQRYFMADHEGMITVANWLHSIPLSLADRFIFATAPVNIRDHLSMNMLYGFVATYAMGRPVTLNIRLAQMQPKTLEAFGDLCVKHAILDLYIWLSFRFPELFIERDICLQQKAHAISLIEATLSSNALQQYATEYSHYRNYKSMRDKLKSKFEDAMPPIDFPIVEDKTREFLRSIPEEDLYVVKYSDGMLSSGHGLSKERGGRGGRGGYQRSKEFRYKQGEENRSGSVHSKTRSDYNGSRVGSRDTNMNNRSTGRSAGRGARGGGGRQQQGRVQRSDA